MHGLTVALLALSSFSSGVLSFPTRCKPRHHHGRPYPSWISGQPLYPSYVSGQPSSVYAEPSSIYAEPSLVYGQPSSVYATPSSDPESQDYDQTYPTYSYYEPSPTADSIADYGTPSSVYGYPTPTASGTPYCPPTGSVQIISIDYTGTGCPSNSISSNLAEDGTNLQLAFDSYYASVGNDTSVASTANCHLTIKFQSPKGWSFSAYQTEYVGYVDLDDKVTAYQESEYKFEGDSKSKKCSRHWTGVLVEDYRVTDVFDKSTMVWSECEETITTLYIDTEVGVDNTDNKYGSGLITTDSINHKTTQNIGLEWNQIY